MICHRAGGRRNVEKSRPVLASHTRARGARCKVHTQQKKRAPRPYRPTPPLPAPAIGPGGVKGGRMEPEGSPPDLPGVSCRAAPFRVARPFPRAGFLGGLSQGAGILIAAPPVPTHRLFQPHRCLTLSGMNNEPPRAILGGSDGLVAVWHCLHFNGCGVALTHSGGGVGRSNRPALRHDDGATGE